MSTLREQLMQAEREAEVARQRWQNAYQMKVEQEKTALAPAQEMQAAEEDEAEAAAKKRELTLAVAIDDNNPLLAANQAAAAEFDRAIDVILGALRSGEEFAGRIGETFQRQQAHADHAANEYMRDVPAVSNDPEQAYQVGMAFKNQWNSAAHKFRNALSLQTVLKRRIRDAKTPQERQFLNAIAYAYRGETYTVTKEYDPQADVDNLIRASRRGR